MEVINNRTIVRACKSRGWTIQPAALAKIEDHCRTQQTGHSFQDIIEALSKTMSIHQKRTVTLQEVLPILNVNQSNTTKLNSTETSLDIIVNTQESYSTNTKNVELQPSFHDLKVWSSFETPRLFFDVTRRNFRVDEGGVPIFGTADDKINMMAQRYAIVHQKILRNKLFLPTNVAGDSYRRSNVRHKLTPIESLLGNNGVNNKVVLLAVLLQIEEGEYYLEDPSGQVPALFTESVVVDGFFVTEHCIFLVEGSFHDGIFYVDRLAHPLQEKREVSLHSIRQQVSHPFYSPRKSYSIEGASTSTFIVLSDVYLDQPFVLQHLESLFASYENHSLHRLPCFILMGNFCSPSSQQPQQHQHHAIGHGRTVSAIEELVNLIEKFPKLARYAHFCLVSGPSDYSVLGSSHLQVLPLPSLDKVMKGSLAGIGTGKKLSNLHFCSNPCRICWSGKELVVFRYDLLHLLQHSQVIMQHQVETHDNNVETSMSIEDDDNHHRMPHCRLVKTILDQGHLLPVPNVPLYWNYDPALRLYPLPDALIIGGDGNSQPYHETYAGCDVIHPGSFTSSASNIASGQYAVFTPQHDVLSEDLSQETKSVEFVTI